ncbi:MAG: prolipoprotein diacylglyceryl transferase, partial [Ruthenibacterium lactatiformans]
MTYHVQFPGLGLEFTLDRVAFTVFGMPIYWYGILIATGLALAIVFAFSHARRFGIDSDRMVDVILIGTVCAVIGGRAFYVATAPFEYASFAEMLDIRLGGVAIYGAVIAAFLSGYFACRWRKVPILPMFDLAGMGFLLG